MSAHNGSDLAGDCVAVGGGSGGGGHPVVEEPALPFPLALLDRCQDLPLNILLPSEVGRGNHLPLEKV